MKVAIMTDTNSGIYKQEAAELKIFVMPMPVLIDGNVYFEGDNLSEVDFYSALEEGKNVTTSQPVPTDVTDMWDSILDEGYDQIVYIPMSSGLSGSCMTAQCFAAEYDNVYVVDNHRISVTMRQSVIRAKELANEGYSAEEICNILENEAYNSTIYVAVNTLEYLKKGGRITSAAATIGTMLNIKPILSIQGEKLDSYTKVRGNIKKCEEKMIQACKVDLQKRFPDVKEEQLVIGGAGAGLSEQEQIGWTEMIIEHFPQSEVFYNPLSASISTHTGPGAVGIGISIDYSK